MQLEYSALGFNANTNAHELYMGASTSEVGDGKECIAFANATGTTCMWSHDPRDIYLVEFKDDGAGDTLAIFSGQRDALTDITLRFVSTEGETVLEKLGFQAVPSGDAEAGQRLLCGASRIPVRDEFNRISCVSPSSTAVDKLHVPCIIFEDSGRRECAFLESPDNSLYFHQNVFGELTTCSLGADKATLTCSPSIRDLTRPISSPTEICQQGFVPVLQSNGDVICRKRICKDEKCVKLQKATESRMRL